MTGTRERLGRSLRRFLAFFAGSLMGLTIDLGGFALLTALDVPPLVANVASSGCAVVAVYLLVTRYAFQARRSTSTFLCFTCWYAANIALTSFSIEVAVQAFGPPAFLWKLCSVPVSFGANYAFSHLLFRGRTSTGMRLAQ